MYEALGWISGTKKKEKERKGKKGIISGYL
jgi:hypothetical protein